MENTPTKKFEKSFIYGTWEMIEAWDIGDDPNKPKEKTYPWGNPSSGYWVYDQSGHFSLIISKNPALQIPNNPITQTPDPEWLTPPPPAKVPYDLLIDTFATTQPYAYFGTYTVTLDSDTGVGSINQEVVVDILRAYTGTKQPRPFILETVNGVDFINIGEAGVYLRKLRRLT